MKSGAVNQTVNRGSLFSFDVEEFNCDKFAQEMYYRWTHLRYIWWLASFTKLILK